MKKEAILYAVIGLLAGFIGGYFTGRAHLAYELRKGVKDVIGVVMGNEEDGNLFFKSKVEANQGAAAATLKTFNGMFGTYHKKGYADLGRIFPIGNDPTVPNNGKYCGLYYEVNNASERVTLIGVADANADCRADGNTDASESGGSYIPSISVNGYSPLPEVKFKCSPKHGYWFALMEYDSDGQQKIPYDKEYSKTHYALVAIPADYGNTGKETLIINQEGKVYKLDRGVGGYIDTYPGPDPTTQGWTLEQGWE